jgi:cytochrome c-type biogenesis protein CcmE
MNKRGYLIGGLLIVVFAALGGAAFVKTMTPYVGFKEAREAGRRVQVWGRIDRTQPIGTDRETGTFSFQIEDENHDRFHVLYDGVRPGNFDQATGVVVIGQYRDGKFHADQMLVKCPSKEQEESLQEKYKQTAAR